MIKVEKANQTTFNVTVEGQTVTKHQVSLESSYFDQLTSGKTTAEKLIEKSFEFLLEREPNTSILQTFDLKVISQYFPEYEATIKKTLK